VQHLTLKATATENDQELGTFTAIVSAWDADREQHVIERTAFDKTIAAWKASGKKLPLLFEHSTMVVGAIDPASMHPTDAGLVVSGEVDRTDAEGRLVWRSVKAGTAGFSIGFMSKSKPREGGGRTLTEIDLLEISATSTPMHPSARVFDWKSAGNDSSTDGRRPSSNCTAKPRPRQTPCTRRRRGSGRWTRRSGRSPRRQRPRKPRQRG
jgi:HK97 family phage prohead protease